MIFTVASLHFFTARWIVRVLERQGVATRILKFEHRGLARDEPELLDHDTAMGAGVASLDELAHQEGGRLPRRWSLCDDNVGRPAAGRVVAAAGQERQATCRATEAIFHRR